MCWTALLLMLVCPALLWAAPAWEVPLTIRSGVAQVTVHFGQWPEAQQGYDGYSDVPAYEAGTLRAWFEDAGYKLWRDIRPTSAEGSVSWQLQLNQASQGDVVLEWTTEHLPPDVQLTLSGHGRVVNLQQQQRTCVVWTQPINLMIEMNKEIP